jgi:hypothetical protein
MVVIPGRRTGWADQSRRQEWGRWHSEELDIVCRSCVVVSLTEPMERMRIDGNLMLTLAGARRIRPHIYDPTTSTENVCVISNLKPLLDKIPKLQWRTMHSLHPDPG